MRVLKSWTIKGLLFACLVGSLLPTLTLIDHLMWNLVVRHGLRAERKSLAKCWQDNVNVYRKAVLVVNQGGGRYA